MPDLRAISLASALALAACAGPAGPNDSPDGGGAPDLAHAGPPAPACQPVPQPAPMCAVRLAFKPGGPATAVSVAGEWNGWSQSAQKLSGPDAQGLYHVDLSFAPGTYGYKFVVDGNWMLDPQNPYRKYEGGVENSGLRVADCRDPSLAVAQGTLQITRAAAGQGGFAAHVAFTPGTSKQGMCQITGTLRRPGDTATQARALSGSELRMAADGSGADLAVSGLGDGKYTITLQATSGGRQSAPLLLPFWIEAQPWQWTDSPIYMVMTDRFRNGDPTNDRKTPGADATADYYGGDLQGVAAAIRDGYFDQRGIRTLWLTPWQTQPPDAFPGTDPGPTHMVSGYHGYWPIKARQVDPRLGGEAALRDLVQAAHGHGMRVLMDAVLHHVHQEHEYLQDPVKKSWFHDGCVCGVDPGCDWTQQAMVCVFSHYLPNLDWTQTAASEQYIADMLWWLQEFDLDGLRIDAVKHVPDLAIFNLATRVRETFENAGTHYYLLGETAMGWDVDQSIQVNQDQYGPIRRYLGQDGLDGQFDFVLYHAVEYRVFAYDQHGFPHDSYWTLASLDQFKGHDMVKFLGSHDSTRFVTLSTYRGQPGWPQDTANHKWPVDGLPLPPPDQEPYDRLWLAMLNLMTEPGIPLLYYGDEHGEYGGNDPDNRHMMRVAGLMPAETAQDARMTALLQARAQLEGLRRGELWCSGGMAPGPGATCDLALSEDVYVYARVAKDPAGSALVALNRSPSEQTVMVTVPPELGWGAGAQLQDYLGGTGYTLSGSALMITVPARGGVILGMK